MVRELQACRTVAARRSWEARWPEHLSGRAAQLKVAAAVAAAQAVRPGPPIARASSQRQPS